MDILTEADLRTVVAGTNDLQEIIDGAKATYHREADPIVNPWVAAVKELIKPT
jgi:hypothetical protein